MYTKLTEISVEILQLIQQLSVSTTSPQQVRNRLRFLRESRLWMAWHWQHILSNGWKMYFSKDFPDKKPASLLQSSTGLSACRRGSTLSN